MSKAGFSTKPREYIPKCRKSDPNPPTFTIRRLNPLELTEISESLSDENETIELGGIEKEQDQERTYKVKVRVLNRMARAKYAVLEKALSGWRNVDDEDGEPIPFSKENIPCLDPDIVGELSELAQGSLTANEAKNSESPSL